MAKASPEVKVSMKWSDLGEGGGSFNPPDGNYLIKQARIDFSAYGKDTGEKVVLFKKVLLPVDAKNKPVKGVEPSIVYYSVGGRDFKTKVDKFKPSADGCNVVLVDPDVTAKIVKSSGYGNWLKYLMDAGFDESDWEGDTTRFEGMICAFHEVAAPKNDFAKVPDVAVAGATENKFADREKKTFVVEEIILDPNASDAPKAKKAAKEDDDEAPVPAKKSKKTPVEDDEEIEETKSGEPDAEKFFADGIKSFMKGKKTADRAEMRIEVYRTAKKEVSPDFGTRVNNMFKDDAKVEKVLGKLGFEMSGDDITEE